MTDVRLHRIFEATASGAPSAIAVVSDDGSMSYGELDNRSKCLAGYLRKRGVREGMYVPLCMERSTELIIGILGVLRAGAAYVPIDPAYPKERIRVILEDADAPIILASAETVDALPETEATVLAVDRDWTASGEFWSEPSEATGGEAEVACVLFTSGSTGTPKGVMVPHRGIVDLVVRPNYIDLGPSDRIAHVSNIGFDAASFEIWGALLNGAQLVIIPKKTSSEPRELAAELRRHEVSVLLLTAALFELLAAWDGGIFDGIRRLLVGGDVVNPRLLRRVLTSGRAPGQIVHVYGPTECATFATTCVVSDVPEGTARIPIGWPISKTKAYVLDSEGKDVPMGTPGEMYLGGPRLARGYLNRPELTRERFVQIALAGRETERLYRTGDLVKGLPDGSFEFVSRIDRQMKIRGYRVEPAEIESCLNAHPAVASSVVMPRRDLSGQASLVVFYLVKEDQSPPSADELSAHLAMTLPDYMIPSVFSQTPEWPLSAHGKVDRAALLRTLRLDHPEEWSAAVGASERALRELCRKVVGASSLDWNESLIAHGLHSLSAANLAWLIEEQLKVRLRLSEILDKPTLGGLLALVEERKNDGTGAADPQMDVRAVRPPIIPLSFPQEQVWFLERLHPHLNSYRFQSLLHFRGALDVGVLEAALNRMVSRHEILRTVFVFEDQAPRQEIRRHVPFRLMPEDLRGLPAAARPGELDRRIYEELRRPFDLAAGPLIRWRLFQVAADEFKLLHTEHHLLHDGWGYGVFLAELYDTYRAISEGSKLAPAPAPTQFADFALWQRNLMASGAWDDQLAFWKSELADCPPPPALPSDRRMGVPRTFVGLQIRRPFPQALWEAVGTVCSRDEVTRFAWIHAAFQLFIHRYTGAEDFCIGSGFANRRDPCLQKMLGMVINTLPIRARFAGVQTFRDLARRASRALRKASDHQELPFERVVQEMNPHRDANANPFFNTCIGAYEDPFARFQSDQLEITSDDAIPCGQVKFDLMALLIPPKHEATDSEKSSAPLILWEFSSELFDLSSGERMLDHFLHLVESSVREPDNAIGLLSLMSKEEEARILRFGESPSPSLGEVSVHEVFDRVARTSPDTVAIEWENGALSYGELNERTSILARWLRSQGVTNGVRVGLCLDRSPEMIVGMLGTLKAGGTYVPLDPSYPSERLDFMSRDAGIALILTVDSFAQNMASAGAKIVSLDRDWPTIESSESEKRVDSQGGNDLAYVMFTSGSTGQPKGVVVPHGAIVRLVRQTNYIHLGPDDRIAHVSNVCFDAATFEIWGALLNGARIVVISKATALEPRQFAATLRRSKVTTIFVTTALFNEMAADDGGAFQSIKQVLFGGEAVTPHWVEHVLKSGAPERLLNVYGPTECTTFATYHQVRRVPKGAVTIPIGRPISNTTTYVLDSHGNPVPVGVPGELYLGGPGLARGYLNRPELTHEKFVGSPFRTGETLYRTGDIVKYLPDGDIEFIGRADAQTKIRGFRIEPGEVEAVLKSHPDIAEAAVVVREEIDGGRRLIGYVVSPNDNIVAESRAYLQQKLPAYMIPSAMVRLAALPLTASGKIDRLALPEPERDTAHSDDAPALTPCEEIVASVWREVLGLKELGCHDNFFELGGHSLLATRVISRLRASFGIEVPLRAVFDNPTVSELGEFIESARQASQRTPSGAPNDAFREEALF